jgi:hypothetical protein
MDHIANNKMVVENLLDVVSGNENKRYNNLLKLKVF